MIEQFKLIDEAISLHKSRKLLYDKAISLFLKSFKSALLNDKLDVVISSRIKQEESLREKILRKKFYKGAESKEAILEQLSDALGIRIECKFVSEEAAIYKKLCSYYSVALKDGFFSSDKYPELKLNLSSPQPQFQQNGNEIYRIDGIYQNGEDFVKVEIQIKSLVNRFWSDIEHSLIYKNTAYMVNSKYLVKMIGSIRSNLFGIDSMLETVKEQIEEISTPTSERFSAKQVVSKMISELITQKVLDNLGFSLNTSDVSALIAIVMLDKTMAEENYEGKFASFVMKIQEITVKEICLKDELSYTPCSSSLVNELLKKASEDFDFYLFFKFYLEIDGNNLDGLALVLERYIPANATDLSITKIRGILDDKIM